MTSLENATRPVRWPRVVMWCSTAVWVLALVAFTLAAPRSVTLLLGIGALVLALPVMVTLRLEALLLVPLFSLTGPAVRIGAAGIILHVGDVYLLLLATAMIVGYGTRGRFSLGHDAVTFLLLLALAAISAAFSRFIASSVVSLVAIGQITALYLLTINRVHSPGDGVRIVRAWIGAVTLSSIMVIVFTAMQKPLLLGTEAADFAHTAAYFGFFRGTFFYTGFTFPLAISIVSLVYQLVRPSVSVRPALAIVALGVNFFALALIANKTAIFATIGVTILVLVVNSLAGGRAAARLRAVAAAAGVLALAGVVVWLRLRFSGADQLPADMLTRYFTSMASLEARFAVWFNVLEYLFHTPWDLFFGIGPDVSVRNPELPLFRSLFVSTLGSEKAADSTYVYLLLNFGLIFCLLLGWGLVRLTLGVLRHWSHDTADLTILISLGIGLWLLMGVTQQTGISKPVFLFVQLVALAQVLSARGRRSGIIGASARRAATLPGRG